MFNKKFAKAKRTIRVIKHNKNMIDFSQLMIHTIVIFSVPCSGAAIKYNNWNQKRMSNKLINI